MSVEKISIREREREKERTRKREREREEEQKKEREKGYYICDNDIVRLQDIQILGTYLTLSKVHRIAHTNMNTRIGHKLAFAYRRTTKRSSASSSKRRVYLLMLRRDVT